MPFFLIISFANLHEIKVAKDNMPLLEKLRQRLLLSVHLLKSSCSYTCNNQIIWVTTKTASNDILN